MARNWARYKTRSFEDLRQLLRTPETLNVTGPSGTEYQIEAEAVWDGTGKRCLRVTIAIDDQSLYQAMSPITDDFLVTKDSDLIGE